MMTVLSCLVVEHDWRFVALAALICVAGSLLSVRLFARVRRTRGGQHFAWLFLASFLAGATIWATHFTAMLGYRPPVAYGFEPTMTFLSLAMAMAMTFFGFAVTARTASGPEIEAGGALVGLGVAAMHYTGMAGYEVAGAVEWDRPLVIASLVLGAALGALATNRLARPITRFCRYGSVLALILAICSMHFTGMAAMTIVPDASAVASDLIPKSVMLAAVVLMMLLILTTGLSIHFIDLQSQKEAVGRYRHLALHDPLTGLPNRANLAARLGEEIETPRDDTAKLAVLAFDLDRFKLVNDVHGHGAGDALLRQLGERLNETLGPGEFVARIGGDEFVAFKPVFTRGEAGEFARRIIAAVEEPFSHDGHALAVGASIGISLMPQDGRDVEDLLSKADLAMYRAKSQQTKADTNKAVCFYESSMDEHKRSRAMLAMDLRRVVERGELELYYQPQNDTATRRIVGFEALLRWKHPARGMIPPDEFIPIAEQSGLICEIGTWVLGEACREAAGWNNPYRIAVNVAPAQLAQNDLPQIVHAILLETGLQAGRLELEITESGIVADHAHALHIIRQLKALGVRLAMDDYGTGYSSLATLKSFPFDKIKIDRSFVDGVTTDPQSAAIVRASIILGTSLGIPVLAEGVETEAHLAFLQAEGCNEVQGYFFGRPMTRAAARATMTDPVEPAPEASREPRPTGNPPARRIRRVA